MDRKMAELFYALPKHCYCDNCLQKLSVREDLKKFIKIVREDTLREILPSEDMILANGKNFLYEHILNQAEQKYNIVLKETK